MTVGRPFGTAELPYGVFSGGRTERARVGVAVGDAVLDLAAFLDDPVFAEPSLNAFMAQGKQVWDSTRARIVDAVASGAATRHLVAGSDVELHRPFDVADFVDFNSSLHHATNLGRILRPGGEPIRPNWWRMPVGYHGRAGTVVVSGTPVRRPRGQVPDGELSVLGPTRKLDVEAEIGFVVGAGSQLGRPVTTGEFADHVFGVVLVLDWSARDIQAFEYVPLGPFLGKSFATTISPWVVPLAALDGARVRPAVHEPPDLDYLRVAADWGLDVRLELAVDGCVVARPTFRELYWTPPQQLAHLTVNGASLRTGDLFASGTVSDAHDVGSLIELSADGARPFALGDGRQRSYLEDGDRVTLSAVAPGPDGTQLSLGVAEATVLPAG